MARQIEIDRAPLGSGSLPCTFQRERSPPVVSRAYRFRPNQNLTIQFASAGYCSFIMQTFQEVEMQRPASWRKRAGLSIVVRAEDGDTILFALCSRKVHMHPGSSAARLDFPDTTSHRGTSEREKGASHSLYALVANSRTPD